MDRYVAAVARGTDWALVYRVQKGGAGILTKAQCSMGGLTGDCKGGHSVFLRLLRHRGSYQAQAHCKIQVS